MTPSSTQTPLPVCTVHTHACTHTELADKVILMDGQSSSPQLSKAWG